MAKMLTLKSISVFTAAKDKTVNPNIKKQKVAAANALESVGDFSHICTVTFFFRPHVLHVDCVAGSLQISTLYIEGGEICISATDFHAGIFSRSCG